MPGKVLVQPNINMRKCGQPMLNDTLAETLVAYFDRHGNANERNHNYYTARQVRLIAEYLCID